MSPHKDESPHKKTGPWSGPSKRQSELTVGGWGRAVVKSRMGQYAKQSCQEARTGEVL